MAKIRKGSVSYYLLYALEKAIDGMVRLDDFTYSSYKYMQGAPELKKNSFAAAIRRLREKGYIEKEVSEGKVVLKLTILGADYLEDKEEPWDGKYRIVIWDIPEKKRRVRDLFRRRIKEWGFKHWQKSVWISKRNVTEKLRKLISDLDMQGMVAVIESDDPSLYDINFHDRGD